MKLVRVAWGKLRGVPLVFFGFGLYRTWIFAAYMDPRIPLDVSSASAIFHGSTAFCALIAAMAAGYIAPLIGRRKAGFATAVLMALNASLNGVAELVPGTEFLLYVGAPLGGIGVALLVLQWCEFYARLNPLRIALYYAGALVFASICTLVVAGYSRPYLIVVGILLPFVCMWCLKQSVDKTPDDVPQRIKKEGFSIPWKLIAFMAAFSFVYGYAKTSVIGFIGLEGVAMVVVPLLVSLAVVFGGRYFNFENMYRKALPVFICVPTLLSLVCTGAISGFCATLSYVAASILVVMVLCSISYRTGISALFLCGLERSVRYVARTCGNALNAGIVSSGPSSDSMGSTVIPIVLIAVIAIVAVLVFSERDLYSWWGIRVSRGDGQSSEVAAESVAMNIQALGKVYGLTTREQEVLQLLAKKKSVKRIADELYITEGTVKAHIQHIYTKLDVHTREGLYHLLGISS